MKVRLTSIVLIIAIGGALAANAIARTVVDEVYVPESSGSDSLLLPKTLINPEAATGSVKKDLVTADKYMVSAANPFASQAGISILANGGNAIDAAVAMQMVLNLVEPQSSGIGGGGFLLSYNASDNSLHTWDGRETAPQEARSDRFITNGKPISFFQAVNSGLSVGTPGLVAMLYQAHKKDGHLPWASLFQPAINLAENGFPISERLFSLLEHNDELKSSASASSYFYRESGQPKSVGSILKNPSLAKVFKNIAQNGPDAFYKGDLAMQMVNAVHGHSLPGDIGLHDLVSYKAVQRQPLCMTYKVVYEVCGMGPPSSGSLAVLQILGILEHTPISSLEPDDILSVHYFSEAGRLAFADRDYYVADPDFIDVPVKGLIDKKYLSERATLISDNVSMGVAKPGKPQGYTINGDDNTVEAGGTTHLVAVDKYGNAVSLTSSIESAFGSKIFVNGFLLNNELTDFSFEDTDAQGNKVANRIEPLKRPRSSMAPMMVFKDNKPFMVLGSPGGSAIINYVAKVLVGVLDWGLSVQDAINLPNMGSRNRFTEIESGSLLVRYKEALELMGHEVQELEFPSGVHAIQITSDGLQGGADPRREGRALGN